MKSARASLIIWEETRREVWIDATEVAEAGVIYFYRANAPECVSRTSGNPVGDARASGDVARSLRVSLGGRGCLGVQVVEPVFSPSRSPSRT